ncbi:MAG: 50S ribosomal protein L20, partial [Nitrospirae bacterium]|nr:50S ribosomal protein L20 [Nitrospirota bacterium]
KANILLDRKALADLAYHDPKAFSTIAETVKTSLAS